MTDDSPICLGFVRRTGQSWKFALMVVGGAVGFLFSVGWAFASLDERVAYGAASCALMFAGLCSIGCPRCRVSVGWRAMTTQDHRDFVRRLASLQVCPACGVAPDRPAS